MRLVLIFSLTCLLLSTGIASATPAKSASAKAAKSAQTTAKPSASAKSTPAKVSKASPAKAKALPTHTVRKGESLYLIARKHKLGVKELKRLNGLKGDLLQPGQVLVLAARPKTAPQPVTPTPPPAAEEPAVAGAPAVPAAAPAGAPALPHTEADLQQVALGFLSTPYRFGAEGRTATDCSGFVQQVFRECGLELPRTAREQYTVGSVISERDWQMGDLLFFHTYARYPSHVGIYLGDGKMIHASRRSRKVVISSVDRPYYRKRYLGARRMLWFDPVGSLIDRLNGVVEEVNDEGMLEADADPDPASAPVLPVPQAVPAVLETAPPPAATDPPPAPPAVDAAGPSQAAIPTDPVIPVAADLALAAAPR